MYLFQRTFNALRTISCFLISIAIIMVCTLDRHCLAQTEDDYLIFSAFLVDHDDRRNSQQQVLLLYHLATERIVDCIRITDGSVLIHDEAALYVVSPLSYGIIEKGLAEYSRTDSRVAVRKIVVRDGLFNLTDNIRLTISNNSMVVGITEDGAYVINYADNSSIKLQKVRSFHVIYGIDISNCFDEMLGWVWPCEIISMNSVGNFAIIRYDSWGGESILYYADMKKENMNALYEGDITGPLCWISDCELLIWKSDNQDYRAYILNIDTLEFSPIQLEAHNPIGNVAYSNGNIAFWNFINDNTKSGIELMLYTKSMEKKCLFYLEETSTESIDSFITVKDNYHISIPIFMYQPVLCIWHNE